MASDTMTQQSLYSLVPFQLGDLRIVSPASAALSRYLASGDYTHAWTALRNGFPIACAGIQPVPDWPGRAYCWSILGDVGRWGLLWSTRVILAQIEETRIALSLRRLEATCLLNWRPGMRWLEILGFQYEGRMIAYDPDGRDHMLWARTWRN